MTDPKPRTRGLARVATGARTDVARALSASVTASRLAADLAGLSADNIATALGSALSAEQRAHVGEQLTGISASDVAAARAEGFRAASARAAAMLRADEHGFGTLEAAEMLDNGKFDAFSADELAKLAAGQPDPNAAKMLDAIRADKVPSLGAGGGSEQSSGDDHGWSRAQARAEKAVGRGRGGEGRRA